MKKAWDCGSGKAVAGATAMAAGMAQAAEEDAAAVYSVTGT